jgi:hypothetical protein
VNGVFVFVQYFFEEVVVEALAAMNESISSTPIVYISSNDRLVSNVWELALLRLASCAGRGKRGRNDVDVKRNDALLTRMRGVPRR